MTVLAAYQKTVQSLQRDGISPHEARATARILVDEVTGSAHAHLRAGDRVLSQPQIARFEEALTQLGQSRPLAYILGKWEFYGRTFASDERALIPRPETELLLEAALETIRNSQSAIRNPTIADLGTGTGCLAISLALELPYATVHATDVSSAALSLARENASTLGAGERVQFHLGQENDWAKPLLEYSGSFDLVVSNPPYIARSEIATLQREVRDYEPASALDGGTDGLDAYRQIAAQCRVLMADQSTLICELGAGQFEMARSIFQEQGWQVVAPKFDFAGISRVLVARLAATS